MNVPGAAEAQSAMASDMGKAAGTRANSTISAAQSAPVTIPTVDRILDLSKSGVLTGPDQPATNAILGKLSDAPVIGSMLSGAKDKVAQYQVMQKYLAQVGTQAWAGSGGTGTDSQLAAFEHANPNDTNFPQALQANAQYVKSLSQMAQGRANAMDAYGANTPQKEQQFENFWRNNASVDAYKYISLPPAERKQFISSMSKPQAQQFISKLGNLESIGALNVAGTAPVASKSQPANQ